MLLLCNAEWALVDEMMKKVFDEDNEDLKFYTFFLGKVKESSSKVIGRMTMMTMGEK